MVSNTNLRPYSEVRLQKELKGYFENPPPYIPLVHVNEKNIGAAAGEGGWEEKAAVPGPP